jgi:hypothetical protein
MRIIAPVIILMLVLIPACTKKKHLEVEPNNTFGEANEISIDDSFTGFMDSPNDRDMYMLNVTKRAIVDVQVSGVKGINLAMKIWNGDKDPRLIKWIDDNRKSSGERLPNLTVDPGIYYIEIVQSDRDPKKTNKENPYELRLKSREVISEESEPNDSKDEANKIYPDKEITGYFSPAYNRLNTNKENLHREEDWYVMDVGLKSENPMLIDVSLSGVGGVDSVLYLIDSDDRELAFSDNGGIGDPEAIVGAGIKKSGRYYIMVAAKGYSSNSDEPYTLNVTLREHDPGFEMEGNDDFENANRIVNNSIAGRVNYKDDRDLFLYQVNGPGIYRIELRPPEDMDAMLTLYNSDKEKIIDVNNAGKGKKEVYPNFYTEKDFYVLVTSKSSAELPKGEYVLTITPFKNLENQELEPNNEPAQANRMTGRVMTGYISSKGDKDYFLITSDAPVREKFEVTGVKGGEIRVSITDPMGYIIKSYDVAGDRRVVFSEMIDKKGYLLIESMIENFDYPYTIKIRGGR